MDWHAILAALSSTAVVLAVLAFFGRTIVGHFFKRDLESHKTALKKSADEILLSQKNAFDRQMESFKSELESRSAKVDRIREEVLRWANPILSAIYDLRSRLINIHYDNGYILLSKNPHSVMGWSATHDYFLPSTTYLFCQYFCWIRILEQRLSFEMFEKHELKDAFFECVRKVGYNLSEFHSDKWKDLPNKNEDGQVFTLEQRALGEIVALDGSGGPHCIGYAEFLERWDDAAFKKKLKPMIDFVEGLSPDNGHRWRRLEGLIEDLEKLRDKCRELLNIDSARN